MASIDEKPNWNRHHRGNKGRRYTYVKHVYNEDRYYDIFGKFFVNPEILTKKQRAKVLRDNETSSFAMNVPYSLNRNYRWEQISTSDDLVSMDASVFSDKVTLDGCDAAYSIGRKTVVSNHCVRNADGSIQSTSNRGWPLVAMPQYITWRNIKKPPTEEEKQKLEVRYVLATVNPTERRYADGLFRRKHSFECWRREKPLPIWFQPDFWDDSNIDEEEYEDADGFDDSQRPPNFTLGDYITDNRRTKPNPSLTSMKSFEFLNAEDSEAVFATIADETGLRKDSFFTEFEMDGAQFDRTDLDSFEQLSTSPNWTFLWLNSTKTSCAVDLSKNFHKSGQKVVFVVVIERLTSENFRILLNGAFPIRDEFFLKDLKEESYPSPCAFLERCYAMFCKTYSAMCFKLSRNVSDCQPIFYPKEFNCMEGITPCVYPKFEDISFLPDVADDFEVFGSTHKPVYENSPPLCDKCASKHASDYNIFDGCLHDFCRDCIRTELSDAILCQNTYPLTCLHPECMAPIRSEWLYVLLPLPITNFYFNALLKHESSASGAKLIECPHCQSFATIRGKPQYNSVDCWNCSMCFCLGCGKRPHFPLTCEQFAFWVEKFRLQRYLNLYRTDPFSVYVCRCGNILHHSRQTWKVICRACDIQYNWKQHYKFDKPTIMLKNFAEHETAPNYIAAKYSDACVSAYETRFDSKTFHNLKNHLNNMAVDADHVELLLTSYKVALYLIELGYAWLYLTRAKKPDEWTTLKTRLTQLRTTVDSITVSVRQGLSIINANEKAVVLNKLVITIMNLFLNV